jgi:hypothetical protein
MMPMNTTAEIHQQNFGLISLFNFWQLLKILFLTTEFTEKRFLDFF